MEKDKKVKVILFAGLILFAVLAMLWEDPVSFEGQEEQYAIKKSEPKEEKERLDKRDIYKLKPKKEDNMAADQWKGKFRACFTIHRI